MAQSGPVRSSTPWTVTAAPVPAGLEHPDAWAVHGAAAVSAAADRAVFGHEDLAYTARAIRSHLANQEHARRLLLVATRGEGVPAPRDAVVPGGDQRNGVPAQRDAVVPSGDQRDAVVGWVFVTAPRTGNPHLAYVDLRVHPGHRRQGLGGRLLAAAEDVARAGGRTTVIAHSEHADEPRRDDPDVLEPPTGSGRVSGREPAAGFAARHGYRLEQTERYSTLALPVDDGVLDRLGTAAAVHATGYRLVHWTDRAPDERLHDQAHLLTRMSTDVPTADLEIEEDPWDGARVRVAEAELSDSNHRSLTVAAEHVASGRLVGFTTVHLPLDKPRVVYQEDTLVVREHRGRRLGMLLKVEALRLLRELRPEAVAVHTWNADENAYMLTINEALGFRRAGVTAMWQRRLP